VKILLRRRCHPNKNHLITLNLHLFVNLRVSVNKINSLILLPLVCPRLLSLELLLFNCTLITKGFEPDLERFESDIRKNIWMINIFQQD
jgi:hypothetical protein